MATTTEQKVIYETAPQPLQALEPADATKRSWFFRFRITENTAPKVTMSPKNHRIYVIMVAIYQVVSARAHP